MGKKANPAIIGAFVLGAIALGVFGILMLGSGRFFRNTTQFVIFFPGAVDGLSVGAPVKIKGVEIGSVTDIRLRVEGAGTENVNEITEGFRIPVFIEIDNDKLSSLGAGRRNLNRPETVKELVAAGLRAQLATQSILTGLLFVQLNLHPEIPAIFAMPDGFTPQEIPAIPTSLERVQSAAEGLVRKLQTVDVARVVASAADALDGINRLVNSPGLHQTVETLPGTLARLDDAVASLRHLVTDLDNREGPLLDSLRSTVDKGRETLDQMRTTLASIDRTLAPTSPFVASVGSALQDVSEAARAVRLLADYLERNPGAIVRGRDVSQK
jgi:phospholipid/cholesterol/gamma-HCH transport system substrate-binding protein